MPHKVMATDHLSTVVPPTKDFLLSSFVFYSMDRLKVIGHLIITDKAATW